MAQSSNPNTAAITTADIGREEARGQIMQNRTYKRQ